VRRSDKLNPALKEPSPKDMEYDSEETEKHRTPSTTTISPIQSLGQGTPEIDLVQQDIYDYIESLENKFGLTVHEKEEHSSSPQEPPVINILKQEIFEMETLNRHIEREHEALKMQNETQRTQNNNILLHLSLWYKKNKKLKQKSKVLKRKVITLKYKILMKKPSMVVARKKVKKTNLDVLVRVSKEMQ